MSEGDLVQTVIGRKPVILIKKVANKVWDVLNLDGTKTSEWVLNLEPYEKPI